MAFIDLKKRTGTLVPKKKSALDDFIERYRRNDRLHHIKEAATEAANNNLPATADRFPDETQREITQDVTAFVAELTRLAKTETSDRENEIRSLLFGPMEMALAKATANQRVKEVEDGYGDDFDLADRNQQDALRQLRKFETDHHLDPLSARYKSDRLMFTSSLIALAAVEGTANAFFLQELSDAGLAGGFGTGFGVGGVNTLAGLGTGYFGLRLLAHRKTLLKLLGLAATPILTTASLTLLLALADLREALNHGQSQIDFRIILDPLGWFAYTTPQPAILFALGVAVFLVAMLKGRGGAFGIVAPYWGHDVADKFYRDADNAVLDAIDNIKAATQNAFEDERKKQRAAYEATRKVLDEIRKIAADAESIEKSLRDSLELVVAKAQSDVDVYRATNMRVRDTEPPAYFGERYPTFDEIKTPRLDLTEIRSLRAQAEKTLDENTRRLAEFEAWVLERQTASVDAILQNLRARKKKNVQPLPQAQPGQVASRRKRKAG